MRPVFLLEHTMQNKMLQAAMQGANMGGAQMVMPEQYPPFGEQPYSSTPWYNNPLPPRDRNMLGAAIGTGGTMALSGALAGAPVLGSLATGAVGAGVGAGGEYLADMYVRQPARDAYNNEYGPNNQAPIGMGPNGPIFR